MYALETGELYVRFTPKADISPRDHDVCFGPLADIGFLRLLHRVFSSPNTTTSQGAKRG
jgi:hypothetical protein